MSLTQRLQRVLDPQPESVGTPLRTAPPPFTRTDTSMLLAIASAAVIFVIFGPIWLLGWGDSGRFLTPYSVPLVLGIGMVSAALLANWNPRWGGMLMIVLGVGMLLMGLPLLSDVGTLSGGAIWFGALVVIVPAAMAIGAGTIAIQARPPSPSTPDKHDTTRPESVEDALEIPIGDEPPRD